MKDGLGGKAMTDLATLRPKTHSFLTDARDENKEEKAQKIVCHKTKTSI